MRVRTLYSIGPCLCLTLLLNSFQKMLTTSSSSAAATTRRCWRQQQRRRRRQPKKKDSKGKKITTKMYFAFINLKYGITSRTFLKMGHPGLFSIYFRLFNTVDSKQINVRYKSLPMTGFVWQTSGVQSNRCTNWATTTALMAARTKLVQRIVILGGHFWELFRWSDWRRTDQINLDREHLS